MPHPYNQDRETKRARLFRDAKECFGVEDTSGVELFSTIHRISRLTGMMSANATDAQELSGPRWSLMLRLFIEEKMGSLEGLTPTDLSRFQSVSKNTISSLLRGLEEQGLIRRYLDPKDLRVFRIQLTDSGRTVIHQSAPGRIERLNKVFAALDQEERQQLKALLGKLLQSLLVSACEDKEPLAGE